MPKGDSFLTRSINWLRSKLNPVDYFDQRNAELSRELEVRNADGSPVHRKSPIPGSGKSLWDMTEWSNVLPDAEHTTRLRKIWEREAATHRIICEKANDIFRAGKEIEADEGIIKQIEDFENNTLFLERLKEACICAMWQGNGHLERLFAGDVGGSIEAPPPTGAAIVGYRVLDPTRCRPVVDKDLKSKTYDKVLYYKLTFGDASTKFLKGHPNRIVPVVLNPDPMAEDHLGKSEIDAIYDAALNKRVADADMVQLIHRKAGMIYHFTVKNAQDEDIEGYQAEYGNMTNVTNLVTSEDIEIEGVGGDGAIANIEAYLKYFEDQICYGLRYPVSLFRGEGQGTISTADTNLISYHEHIQNYQENSVGEILETEYDIMLNGWHIGESESQRTFKYEIKWNPLGEKDKKRDADVRLSESQAFVNMVNGGLDLKAALALTGWDTALEDMGVKVEEKVPEPAASPPNLPGQGPASPAAKPGAPPQTVPPVAEPKMSRAGARAVIGRRGPKEYEPLIKTLKDNLAVAIADLGLAISERVLKEGLKPSDVKLGMPETDSANPVDNLFLRAMMVSLMNSFTRGYRAGKEDAREIKTGRKILMLKLADEKKPRTPDDIEIPPEWFNLYPAEDLEFLRQYTFKFSIDRGQQFEHDLKEVLIEDLEAGKSIPQIRRDIQLKAAEMSTYEAERIARTEVLRASNEGRLRAYHSEGVERVEYIAADDERTCEICAPLDGKEYPMTDAKGLLPQHPNCRCTYIPIP